MSAEVRQGHALEVLSYGGGRQTAGMLAMIKLGTLSRPDVILFADTGGELPETYQHIEQWARPTATELDIPFHVVSYRPKDGLDLYGYSYHYRWLPQPWQRMCTSKFKIYPIEKFLRPYKKQGVRMWIGISFEESHRIRINPRSWIQNYYPLIEKGLTVHDCIQALIRVGASEPPKSACFYCPFQKQNRWKLLQSRHPDLFQKAVALEEHAREKNPQLTLNGKAPLRLYLEGNQLAWEELLQGEGGCNTGACFV